jgi:hypothetical protein
VRSEIAAISLSGCNVSSCDQGSAFRHVPFIKFGDDVPGQDVPVSNGRAVRASAGILFLFAISRS